MRRIDPPEVLNLAAFTCSGLEPEVLDTDGRSRAYTSDSGLPSPFKVGHARPEAHAKS